MMTRTSSANRDDHRPDTTRGTTNEELSTVANLSAKSSPQQPKDSTTSGEAGTLSYKDCLGSTSLQSGQSPSPLMDWLEVCVYVWDIVGWSLRLLSL